jgi:hypothetical protein
MTAASGSQNGRQIGINIGDKGQFRSQVDDLVNTIKASYGKYNTQMSKFQQTKELNQKLATSFKSKLLASYTQLFEVLKTEMKKMSELIGANSDLTDLTYVSQLTQQQMGQLQTALNEQASSLSTIYTKYGMTQEASALQSLLTGVGETTSLATRITATGGARRKGTQTRRRRTVMP